MPIEVGVVDRERRLGANAVNQRLHGTAGFRYATAALHASCRETVLVTIEDGALVAQPKDGLGLLWSTFPTPPGFEISIDFRLDRVDDNSGVFVRFSDPESFGYENAAWAAVHDGLEVQIDETARPGGADVHRTGAFYEIPGQTLSLAAARPPGTWNTFTIRASGDDLSVDMNGARVTTLAFAGDPARPLRGRPSELTAPRFIGIQTHTGRVAFRNVRLKRLP